MSVQLHPIHWLALFGLVIALVMLAGAFRCRGVALKILLIMLGIASAAPAGLVVMVSYPEWVDPRFRVYKDFFAAIQPGMSRDDVKTLLEKHYPESGPRSRPILFLEDESSLNFFMHPEPGHTEPNCEGILLKIENDRVTTKTYSPD
ncbi:MAG: hypothetical protein JNN17_17880 [Verrucomicrobiaceae bacterium]|nr:hypothetical protein [Verrucomicrobiaceae bacterium]